MNREVRQSTLINISQTLIPVLLRLFAPLLSTAFLALVAAAVTAPVPLTLYVATNGNDHWSGRLATPNKARTDGPLSSLAEARDRIRGERIGNQPVQVLVRGGTYILPAPFVLGPQDSGTAEAPVVYAAFEREKPVFSGGRVVTGVRQIGNLWETTIPEVKAGESVKIRLACGELISQVLETRER